MNQPARLARLERLTPDVLSADQQLLFNEIAGGKRAQGPQLFQLVGSDGALEGPFNAFLLQPNLGRAVQAVGAAVRYETSLTARCREIAILLVAVQWNSEFEWYAHEAVGRHVGLTDAEFEALKSSSFDEFSDRTERAVAAGTASLAATGDATDEVFDELRSCVGEAGIFELTTLVGYYALLALQLRVYRVKAPADA